MTPAPALTGPIAYPSSCEVFMLFKIVTDAACSLPGDLTERFGLTFLPALEYGEENLPHNNTEGIENSFRNAASQCFDRLLAEGNDLLYVGGAAEPETFPIAAEALAKAAARYPARKCFSVDTRAVSLGLGLLVLYASALRMEGKTLAETRDWLETNRMRAAGWAAVEEAAAAVKAEPCVPPAPQIPNKAASGPDGTYRLLRMDHAGRFVPAETVPSRDAALERLTARLAETAVLPEGQTVCIVYRDCPADAGQLRARITGRTGAARFLTADAARISRNVPALSVPGALAVFYMAPQR